MKVFLHYKSEKYLFFLDFGKIEWGKVIIGQSLLKEKFITLTIILEQLDYKIISDTI